MHSLGFAIRTLTRLPIGSKPLEDEEKSLKWFPLVGLIYGAVGWAIAHLCFPPAVLAALIIGSWAYLSRGFHLDGLADFSDGLGGGFTAERTLEIMRDVHIGAFGALALIVVLLIQYSTLTTLVAAPLSVLLVPLISRSMIALSAATLPYGRAGTGSAQKLVSGAKARHSLIVAGQLVVVGVLVWLWGREALLYGYLWAVGFATLTTLVVLRITKKRIGGLTGDVLGAIATLSECAALVGFVLPLA
ncbi:MAG TPA: adenosylcobinamide-GDP ribazoletransferase [Sphaerochaeta sp.]|nr:adenosylcobinamide-GDP ribazoletransferase [Sphaerochaeta sp.]